MSAPLESAGSSSKMGITSRFSEGMVRVFATVSVMLVTIIAILDMTIASVALPHMQGTFGSTQEQVSWVLSSYIVASAITMPLTGFIAGRFGTKKVLIVCVLGFTAMSILCGAAQSIEQIVVFRILQGMFGALLMPLSQSVMLAIYPEEKRGAAMAIWGMGIMLGPIMGPVLGGWLTEYYSWRWVFYINIPFGFIAWFGLHSFLTETPRNNTRRFDVLGFLFLGTAIGALQLMLDRGETQGWFESYEIIIELSISVLAFYLFVVQILTANKEPFFETALFADRNFVIGLVLAFYIGILTLTSMVLLPPYLVQLGGYPVIDVGLLLAPRGAGVLAGMILMGRFTARVDYRYPIFAGQLIITYSLWQMTHFTVEMAAWHVVLSGAIQGAGMGLIFGPLSVLTFSTLPQRFVNDGTSLSNLIRSIGSSIGLSVVIAKVSQFGQANHAGLAQFITPFNLPLRQAAEQGMFDLESPEGLAKLNGLVTEQSYSLAFLQDFRLLMWVSLCSMLLVLILRKPAIKPISRTATMPQVD